MKNVSKDVADILIGVKVVSFRFDPPFTFTSGIKSPIYLDNRVIMSYPKEREMIVDKYIAILKGKIGLENIDYISATATAAIPQGAWIAQKLGLPMVFCRSAKKGHGKENQIEGYLKKSSRVVIIEDHISTAGSAIVNATAIRALSGMVSYVVATTTYETKKSFEELAKAKLTLFTLTTGKHIIDRALSQKIVTIKQKKMIDEWFVDPAGWGEKHGYNV
jgi:orotate phosphoribosyltransferase